jgi:hypothetical protein
MDDLTKKLLRRLAETVLEVLREDAPKAATKVQPATVIVESAQVAPTFSEGDVVRCWNGNMWIAATVASVVNRGKDKGKIRAFVARVGKRNKNLLLNADQVYPLQKDGAK